MKKINMDEFTEKYHDYLNRYANQKTTNKKLEQLIDIESIVKA